ncbi:cylicin-1 [Tripterygium wilfordii]|uniref:Cylicin-1 n=1 Tax=Tripterygium wilfordii TaxID=458696 RepID=A0A7J7DN42_TRIWF|nr:cylicin-1 [Tripterygium wilfordii]
MKKGDLFLNENVDIDQDDVYHTSSGDEKKWIMEYHQSRPGLRFLQQRIDDFISAHRGTTGTGRLCMDHTFFVQVCIFRLLYMVADLQLLLNFSLTQLYITQERKEREAQAAEGGWTVVVHYKGRKKTTDSESGITVGSVAQAAVEEKMTKKKKKKMEVVGFDFYRFKKREDRRNEIWTLQSKFEQRIKSGHSRCELPAARKFRPY